MLVFTESACWLDLQTNLVASFFERKSRLTKQPKNCLRQSEQQSTTGLLSTHSVFVLFYTIPSSYNPVWGFFFVVVCFIMAVKGLWQPLFMHPANGNGSGGCETQNWCLCKWNHGMTVDIVPCDWGKSLGFFFKVCHCIVPKHQSNILLFWFFLVWLI